MVMNVDSKGEGVWETLAADVTDGWLVTSNDSTGEMKGHVAGTSHLERGVLSVTVRWSDDDLEGSLRIPIRRRNVRLIKEIVLISSSDSLITLEPARD